MVTEPARILLGDVEVTRVPEYAGKSPATPGFLFPDSSPAYWADNAGWLDPDFYDAANGTLRTVLHTWLIRSQGRSSCSTPAPATARNARTRRPTPTTTRPTWTTCERPACRRRTWTS